MNHRSIFKTFLVVLSLLLGCGESQQFVAIPSNIDRETVQKDTIEVIAKDFEFIPDTIRVHQGTLVTLKVRK